MSEDNTANHQDAKVTVYSTSWCAFCHTEMEWLKKLGIDFVAKDIEADPSAKEFPGRASNRCLRRGHPGIRPAEASGCAEEEWFDERVDIVNLCQKPAA